MYTHKMENCFFDSKTGQNSCDEIVEQEPVSDFLFTFFDGFSTAVNFIAVIIALNLLVIRYWNGSRNPTKTIYGKSLSRILIATIVIAFISQIFTGPLGDYSGLFTIVGIAAVFILLTARYAMRVATRTGRSRVGFIWLSVFFPGFILIICLILDKDSQRYALDGRDTYKPQINQAE
jgi:hypothetical protein